MQISTFGLIEALVLHKTYLIVDVSLFQVGFGPALALSVLRALAGSALHFRRLCICGGVRVRWLIYLAILATAALSPLTTQMEAPALRRARASKLFVAPEVVHAVLNRRLNGA